MRQSSLKMEAWGGYILMVEVLFWSIKQNNYLKLYLTLDTGASVTTLSKDLLFRLGYSFQQKNNQRITTASGVEFVEKIKLKKMKIGVFELEDIEVYAHTFPGESFSLGVLGLDVLSQFDIELIFSKKEVVFKEIVEDLC